MSYGKWKAKKIKKLSLKKIKAIKYLHVPWIKVFESCNYNCAFLWSVYFDYYLQKKLFNQNSVTNEWTLN